MYRTLQRPLETASIFKDNRPRLRHTAPLLELLKLVIRYKSDSNRYREIKETAEITISSVGGVFLNDIVGLAQLDYELERKLYRITSHGKIKLEHRLNDIYGDGYDFILVSSKLESVDIPPLMELDTEITETEGKAVLAMNSSKRIGEEIGIEVRYNPTESLSPYQPFSSLSSLE